MICLPTKNILFPNHCAIITLNIRWVLTCNKCRVLSMSYAKCSYTIHITCCGKYFEPLFCVVYRIEKKKKRKAWQRRAWIHFFFSLVRMDCCNGKWCVWALPIWNDPFCVCIKENRRVHFMKLMLIWFLWP